MRWSEQFDIPTNRNGDPVFDLESMVRHFTKKGIVRALEHKGAALESMMTQYVQSDSTQERYGIDAVMFLTDLNILCGEQIHWVMLNNAFQESDAKKYSTKNRELKLIYDLIASLMNIYAVKEKVKCCYQCHVMRSECAELRWCRGCQQVRYCSRRCQKVSWKNQHRHECKFLI